MSSQPTFIDLCLRGKVLPDEIDNFIDRWHETPEGRELHDYLGMTEEEYALWLRVPDALAYIIKARQQTKPLAEAVSHGYQDLRLAARPDDQSKISRLQKWLQSRGKLGFNMENLRFIGRDGTLYSMEDDYDSSPQPTTIITPLRRDGDRSWTVGQT
jgi:hypothetical protein